MNRFTYNTLHILALLTVVVTYFVLGLNMAIFTFFALSVSLYNLTRNHHVLGANTFDAALVTDVAKEQGITILQSKLSSLKAFSRDFSTDVLAPKKTVQVPKITAGATGQTNPTNFEQGDSTMDNIAVSPDELSVSFHITNAQMQQGFRLAQLLQINLHVLAKLVMSKALVPVTAANYGAAVVNADAEDFGTDDLKTLHAAAKEFNMKNLVLDGSYLSQFIPTDKWQFALGEQGAYGFDGMYLNNYWTGAEASVQGFVSDPQALGVAAGLPQLDPAISKLMLIDEVIILENLGMAVKFNVWGSLSARTVWGSYGLMFGAAAGDTDALKIVKLVP